MPLVAAIFEWPARDPHAASGYTSGAVGATGVIGVTRVLLLSGLLPIWRVVGNVFGWMKWVENCS